MRGFTLAEIVIVMAIFSILAVSLLFLDLNNFRGDSFRAEVTTIGTLLQTARANSLNNIDQAPHGVAFFPFDYPHSYVLFEGESYGLRDATRDQVFDASYPILFAATAPTEVVFSQLSGDAPITSISMKDSQRPAVPSRFITINSEGGISW